MRDMRSTGRFIVLMVVFWKLDVKTDKDRDTGELKIKQFPILKYYYVFHVDEERL